MIWNNPCKKCITRAVCNDACKQIENHGNFIYYFIQGTMILLFLCILSIPVFIIKYHWTIAIIEVVVYLSTYHFVFEALKDNPTDTKLETILVALFGPFLLILIKIFDRYENKIDGFIFRFNKRLN